MSNVFRAWPGLNMARFMITSRVRVLGFELGVRGLRIRVRGLELDGLGFVRLIMV